MHRFHCMRKQILTLLVLSAALMFGTSVNAQKGNLSWREDLSSVGGAWVSLGIFNLNAGDYNAVGVSRWTSTAGYVIAAVRIVRR